MLKKNRGFTLVELVIVIVIVGILSVISVPVYRGYVQKAKMTEGQVLVGAIVKSQLAYHVKNGTFYDCGGYVQSDRNIDMDASGNKYFRQFDCWVNGGGGGVDTASALPSKAQKVNQLLKYDEGPADDYDYNEHVWILALYRDPNTGQTYTVSTTLYATGATSGMIVDAGSNYPGEGGGSDDPGPTGPIVLEKELYVK